MRHPRGPSPPAKTRAVIRVARRAVFAVLFVTMAVLGSIGGVLFAYGTDLPEISRLDDYRPPEITRLLALDGSVVAQYATERRMVVSYEEIAPVLRQAIIATEDSGFEQHFGLSVTRLLVTVVRDIVYGERTGASTITQQLARDQFLTEYRRGGVFVRSGLLGLERKVKEMLIAIQMERRYTKREILTFYANQINLGPGVYGVEAASQMYFGKPALEVTLEEAATIAAAIQRPGDVNPYQNPQATVARRNNIVLSRMVDTGVITSAEAQAARDIPLQVRDRPLPGQSVAPYFAEEIRKHLEQEHGYDALYQAGLTVHTTLDPVLQDAANRALDRELRRIDKLRSDYRGPRRNLLADGDRLEDFSTDRWTRPLGVGDVVPAVVTALPAASSGAVRVRVASHEFDLDASAYAWTGRAASRLFEVGDLIEVGIRALTDDGVPRTMVLEQAPEVEGAVIAIDNRTGQIRAMVGGYSFARSQFNRAIQAQRQVGSLFKPIVFTAAIDRGFTPVSEFIDEPVSYDVGPGQPLYEPLNYDREFKGPVTLRSALEESRNIPAVKAMAAIGPAQVASYAGRFGLRGDYPPFLSMALGAAESSLQEMTSAYSVFPNQGVRMVPYAVVSITDRDGNILEENRPRAQEAIRADTAFVMTNLLRGVIDRGTGASARSLDWPLAGKTGTMDEYTDAWFVGFDPTITVGVWIGYDEKKPIGPDQTGASAALPVWIDVMRAQIEHRGDRDNPPQFDAPGNIVFVTLETGITEAFINGTQPQDPSELRLPGESGEPAAPVAPTQAGETVAPPAPALPPVVPTTLSQ